ncbi:MAG: hypothetical protein K1X35_07175 [Caulobacteraceae bacterium]|nr:hypothetical protein [Caulobacteraceae bacterium]
MAAGDSTDNPVRIQPARDGWRWSVIDEGRVAAEGQAPDAHTAERYGAFAAAAVASFGRIGRAY